MADSSVKKKSPAIEWLPSYFNFLKKRSSMRAIQENQNLLPQIDLSNRPISLVGKKNIHLKGILHHAFSIFIFHESDVPTEITAKDRLQTEMGFSCPLIALKFLDKKTPESIEI
jgi:hypothetical protein